MKYKSINDLSLRFKRNIIYPVNVLLNQGLHTPAVILLCCGVDYLAKYFSGDANYESSNKTKFITFLKHYFPEYESPEDFYSFIRCGLVHSYNMGYKYRIIRGANSDEKPHMSKVRVDTGEVILINPWQLKSDIRKALNKFSEDIEKDNKLYSNFVRVFYKDSLRQPTIRFNSINSVKRLK